MDPHAFTPSMLSESNVAEVDYDAMGIYSPDNAIQGAGDVVQSDALNGSETPGTEVPVKRKRGRPRKYAPSNVPAVMSTAAKVPAAAANRAWVRSTNAFLKQHMEDLGSFEVQMKVHVLSVPSGQEISSKILAFIQQAASNVTILCVTGTISNATLCQDALSGETVTYEGPFVILTLSGSFFLSQKDEHGNQKGSMSILFACPDGRVVSGIVAGPIIAASPVEVVLGTYHAEEIEVQEKIDCTEPESPLADAPLESMGQSTSP